MHPTEQNMDQDRDGRCKALTRHGKPCKAAAMEGGLCFFHAHPEKVAELGRLGGRRNRRAIQADPASSPPVAHNESIVHFLTQALVDLRSGRIKPREATAIAQLGRAIIYAREEVEFERKIAELEKANPKDAAVEGAGDE